MYGQLYVHDGATAQAIDATPAKMTGFATAGPAAATRDGNLGVVPSLADDHIAIKANGIYRVKFTIHATVSAAAVVQAHARFGTTEIAQIAGQDEALTGRLRVVLVGEGIYVPSADGNISVYLEAGAAINITPVHASLVVERLDG